MEAKATVKKRKNNINIKKIVIGKIAKIVRRKIKRDQMIEKVKIVIDMIAMIEVIANNAVKIKVNIKKKKKEEIVLDHLKETKIDEIVHARTKKITVVIILDLLLQPLQQ